MLQYLRIPTPRKFVGFFDLQHGAELILMSMLVNKCSGIFGVLAIFSGAQISAVQLSMYIYSLSLFGFLIYLTPQIPKRLPLPALSFAYLYLLDSVINISYTLLFAASWFFVLSSNRHVTSSPVAATGKTINGNSRFTSPTVNVSSADAASSTDSVIGGQQAVAVGFHADAAASGIGAGVLQPESATSILLISVFWAVRLYFIVIVFAWARQVVRSSATPHEELFEGRNGGGGWQGRLGRALISVGRGYWRGNGWTTFGGNKRRTSLSDGSRFRRDRMTVEV